jgi:Zinc finger C-x8-C-x5-C-x3-H type (and similar)
MQEETECAYYLRTGQCKFGGTCKFHHPQPSNAMISLRGGASSSIYSPQAVTSPVYAARASYITSPRWQGPSSYAQVILPQGLVQVPGWNPYPVSMFHLCLFIDLVAHFFLQLFCASFTFTFWRYHGMPSINFSNVKHNLCNILLGAITRN